MNAEDMERLKRHFSVVAEDHQVILTQVQQFREDVKKEFREVRALLKFSFAELDHRIQSL